ncbi:SLAM family member 9-like isoform X2 [Clupea harengus]|uniref:SLAM family member 9-like isoform X2 n=1 Tax=Clupea harengus TaxID=7950 RepID=A0A6P8F3D8_CLUHA|nr:SLAM family member 9-like isoform X2 [Clupea harengus]
MDPKWTLSLLAAILHTVASAPESVFAQEGNSVTLIMQWHNNTDIDSAVWFFNQSCDIVRYYPYYNKSRQVRVTDPYKGRVEFDSTTFSLELTNPQKNDSGLYKGEINADGRKAVSEYRLNVLEQVTAPVLTVESVLSSGDLCNVTVTCRAGDLSLTSTCDISTCTQEEQTAPSSLAISIKDDLIICNHSNPVSWHHATVELEMMCQSTQHKKHQKTSIWIYVAVASGLLLFVLVGGVLCFQMHSKNQAGSSSAVNQSVETRNPSSDVKRWSPFKSYSTVSYALKS